MVKFNEVKKEFEKHKCRLFIDKQSSITLNPNSNTGKNSWTNEY